MRENPKPAQLSWSFLWVICEQLFFLLFFIAQHFYQLEVAYRYACKPNVKQENKEVVLRRGPRWWCAVLMCSDSVDRLCFSVFFFFFVFLVVFVAVCSSVTLSKPSVLLLFLSIYHREMATSTT